MEHDQIVVTEEIPQQEVQVSAGAWHYIQVFCAFFCSVATFAAVTMVSGTRTHFTVLLGIIWFFGVVAGVLVSPGKYFKFGGGVFVACVTFGWFAFPFPLDLLTGALSLPIGAMGAFFAMIGIPAIFTIRTYVTDIRYEKTDDRKETAAIAAGIGAAILCMALFLGLTAVGKAVEAPELEAKFNATQLYDDYRQTHGDAKVYQGDVLEHPVTANKLEDGYMREYYYEFTQQEGGLLVQYNLVMEFRYANDKWSITNVTEVSKPVACDPLGGTWTGTGKFPANLSAGNQYTLKLDASMENGGTGTLEVTHTGWVGAQMAFTVEFGPFSDGYTEFLNSKLGTVVNLKLVLDEPYTYENFGTKTLSEIECVYCFATDTVMLKSLDRGLTLQPNT